MARRGYRTINISTKKHSEVAVYASPRVADALEELEQDMSLYHGVRFLQVVEAAYEQGRKDGAAEVIQQLKKIERAIPHRRPGRPKKKRK